MTTDEDKTMPEASPVIETPGGTTSPDNSRSGAAAYVIFGVSVGILLALVLMLSSCMSTLSDVALRRAERSGDAWSYDYDYQYYYDDQFEGYPDDGLELLEDLYTDYFVDPVTNA